MLTGLIIPQAAEVAAIMQTRTAQRLIQRGARLYLLDDGKTNVLSINRPANAFACAWGMGGRNIGSEPCAA